MWGGCSGCLKPFVGAGYIKLTAIWARRLKICTGVKEFPLSLCTPCWRRLLVAYRFRRLCRTSARILRQTVKKHIIKKEENASDVKFELFNQSSKNDWEGFEEPSDFQFNELYDQNESLCDFKSVFCESIPSLNQTVISKTEDTATVIHFPLDGTDYLEENNDDILRLDENGANEQLLKCELCYSCFSNDSLLENHLKEKHFHDIARVAKDELPLTVVLKEEQIFYKCLKCCQEFSLVHAIEEHLKQHYEVNSIVENAHQFTFLNSNPNEEKSVDSANEFKIRKLTASNSVSTKVDEAVLLSQPDHFVIQRIENRGSRNDSKTTVLDKKLSNYKMAQCKFCFKTLHRSSLLKHIRESHTEALSRQNLVKYDNFSRPTIRYAPKALLKCPKCGKKFKLSHILDAHMRQHYGLKPFVCQICYKELSNQKTFKMHMNRHNGRRNYVCNICDKVFAYPTALEMHKRIHLGIKKFACKECNVSFTQSSHLKSHMTTHSLERPFRCNHCEKSFKTNSLLKCHMERHKGLRNYVCSVCGKSFLTSGELNVHVRSHSSEKTFSCALCNSVFKTRRQLSEHNRRHTGERPFKCDICSKDFMTSQVLKRHYMIHTGVKPHVCHLCNTAYTQKYKLNKHLESHKQTLQGICFEA